jgi:hypothetical protein
MQYLEMAWDPRLKPASPIRASSQPKPTPFSGAIVHFAIGEGPRQEGMPMPAQTSTNLLRQAEGGKQILDAVKLKNFEQASAASAAIGKACAECHENYR